jgi:hypothetical protein
MGAPRAELVGAALAQLRAADIETLVRALRDGEHLTALAQALNVKKAAIAAHPEPAVIVRARLRSGPPSRRIVAAMELAGPCSDECIGALGPRADDPGRDDMLEVLPALLERWGAPIVTLMLAAYVAMEAPCAAVFEDLLTTDERFVIGEPADDAVPRGPGAGAAPAVGDVDDVDDPEKRARRKAAAERKKEAARRAREAREAAAAALRTARHRKPER